MGETKKLIANFFAESATFTQTAAQAFGPVDANNFRLTSSFTVASNTMAYSICKGVVLVQPQTGSTDKVNLLLRPFTQPFPNLTIKYFVYRGLFKTDFFTTDNKIKSSGTDFIDKINTDFDSFYDGLTDADENPIDKPPFLSSYIGFDAADDKIPISNYFFKQSILTDAGGSVTETDGFELPMINLGKSLGRFASGAVCGIDVVLDYGDYKHDFNNGEFDFNLAYARSEESIITLSGDEYAKKLQREQTTQFIDIAAFYGLFAAQGKVTLTGGATTTEKTGTAIYTDLLTHFINKNNWYIYIKSDRGRSYNFYNNYTIGATTNHLNAGITSTLSPIPYETHGWPLIINSNPQTPVSGASLTVNSYFVQLVTDNSDNIGLYGVIGNIVNADKYNFCDSSLLKQPIVGGIAPSLTQTLHLTIPAITEGAKNNSIASICLLNYKGTKYGYQVGISTIYPNFHDDIFNVVDAKPLLKTTTDPNYFVLTSYQQKVSNYSDDGVSKGLVEAQTATIFDTIDTGVATEPTLDRVTYMMAVINAQATLSEYVTDSLVPSQSYSSSSSATNDSNQFKLPDNIDLAFHEIKISSTESIYGIRLITINDSPPNIFLVGLTKAENDILNALIANTTNIKNPHLFFKADQTTPYSTTDGTLYYTYKACISAEVGGFNQLLSPSPDIILYSLKEKNYLFSEEYSKYLQLTGSVYYYSIEGEYLGEGRHPENNRVKLARVNGKAPDGSLIFSPIDWKGNPSSQWTVLHNDFLTFKQILGTVFTEVDAINPCKEEAAAIYGVMKRRSEIYSLDIGPKLFEASKIYGWKQDGKIKETTQDIIDVKTRIQSEPKYKKVFAGLLMGMFSGIDYSNGATTWQGDVFPKHTKGSSAFEDYYQCGFLFTDPTHNVFSLTPTCKDSYKNMDYKFSGKDIHDTTIDYVLYYKYQSTAGWGGSVFMDRTPQSFADGKTTPNWKVARTIYLNANHEIQKIQEDNSKSANQKKQEISDKTLAMNSDLMAFANTRKKDARL